MRPCRGVEAGMANKVAPQGWAKTRKHESLQARPWAGDKAVPPHLGSPLGEANPTQRAALSCRACLRSRT